MTKTHEENDQAEAKQARGRYRKVKVRMWGDEKFRALSKLQPSGQSLWLFLIAGPMTGPIPGLFRAGRAAMAEELDWSMEAFDEAFREVLAQGMAKADFKARVVWIPKAIEHNRPESPNVVVSWANEFDLIPECELKREAYESLKAHIYGLGEAFTKAFDKAFEKASAKSLPKAMPNQEQEQEQEQEQKQEQKEEHEKDAGDLLGDQPANQKIDPTDVVLEAYHRILPLCRKVHVVNPKREKRILAAIKLARQVCGQQGWRYIAEDFWEAYFLACDKDPWLRGAKPYENNPRWKQCLDTLIAEDRFADVMDQAITSMQQHQEAA